MTDWKSRLREADPGRDAVMADSDVQRIRQMVLSAASAGSARPWAAWPRAFVVTAAMLIIVCASALAGLHRVTARVSARHVAGIDIDAGEDMIASDGERQQLQFRTPGGTRIIWVFDSRFEAGGTVP